MYGPNTRKLVSNRTAAWKSTVRNPKSCFSTVLLPVKVRLESQKTIFNRTITGGCTAENSESWFLTVQLSLNDLCYILSTQFSGILSLDPAEFSKYFFHLSALADGSL